MEATPSSRVGKSRRPRWTPSEDAKALLETIFSADSFPTFTVRNQLAEQLGIDSRQVQIWFQNRRQRERIKLTAGSKEDDEDEPDEPDEPATHAPAVPSGASSSPPPAERPGSGEEAPAELPRADMESGERGPQLAGSCSGSGAAAALSSAACASAACSSAPETKSEEVGSGATAGLAALASLMGSGMGSGNSATPAAAAAAAAVGRLDLPSTGIPPALLTMLDTPGGPRALAVAARSLLMNNPILQHPGAPCHTLLTQLAGIQGSLGSNHDGAAMGAAPPAPAGEPGTPAAGHGSAGTQRVSAAADVHSRLTRISQPTPRMAAMPNACAVIPAGSADQQVSSTDGVGRRAPPSPSLAPGDLPPRARPTGAGGITGLDNRMVRQSSSEALEVLSSQFFSG